MQEFWKSVAVPSVMCAMDVVAGNDNEIEKLELGQKRVTKVALNAPRYAPVKAIRGNKGWSMFRERYLKETFNYRVYLERMEDVRGLLAMYTWKIYEIEDGESVGNRQKLGRCTALLRLDKMCLNGE